MNDQNLVETQYFQPGEDHPASVNAGSQLGEFKPWITIWTSPRQTIRQILNTDPTLYLLPLICLIGIAEVLQGAAEESLGVELPLSAILLLAVVFGPIAGFILIWASSHLIRISGRWIDGAAGYKEIRTAVVWGSIPIAATLPLWIPLVGILGRDAFHNVFVFPNVNSFQQAIVSCLILFQGILAIWAFVLSCHTVAEVQGYKSAWKGLGNQMLAGLLLLLIILAIIVPILLLGAVFVGLLHAVG